MPGAAPLIDYEDLLASAETMEALPVTVGRLATLVASGVHDLREVVEVVSLDQALTASLLRRANTASSAGRAPIRTVRDAAVRLGTSSLLSMALAVSVSGRMSRALPGYGLAEGQLWRQSVAASLTAEVVRSRARIDVPVEAATAALLHDFGKVVLSTHFGPQVLELLARAAEHDHLPLLDAEVAVFGLSHADIGGMVAQLWKLPHTIVDAIIHHHATGPDQTPISAAVSLAHAMVPEVLEGLGAGPDDLPDQPPTGSGLSAAVTHEAVMAVLGLPPQEYDDLLATCRARYVDLADRYQVG